MITIIGYGKIGNLYSKVLDDLGLNYSVYDPFLNDYKKDKTYLKSLNSLNQEDTAIIATPPSSHFEIVKNLTKSGINCLLEKPAGINHDELQGFSTFDENLIQLAYHTKFNPTYLSMKNILKGKKFNTISVEYAENVLDYHKKGSWVFNPKISGGGCLIDSGINIFSILYEYMDNITVNRAQINYEKGEEFETSVDLDLKTNNEIEVNISINWMSNFEKRIYTFQTDNEVYELDLATGESKIDNKVVYKSSHSKVDEYSEYYELLMDYLSKGANRIQLSHQLKPLKSVLDVYKFVKEQSIYEYRGQRVSSRW